MKYLFADYLLATGRCTEEALATAAPELVSGERVGRLAMLHGLLTATEVDRILLEQRATRRAFGEIAVRLGLLNKDQLLVLLTGQAIRACVGLMEQLVISRVMEPSAGRQAVAEFLLHCDFGEVVTWEATSAF